MSRGFVREGDQEEVPMIPKRADLPDGVVNFVTPEGMDLLLEEKEELIRERENLESTSESERRIAKNLINARLQLLNARITDARLVDIKGNQRDEITFGAKVSLKNTRAGKTQTFRIVGVDEADIAKGKISFLSPLARALMNKKVGEIVSLKRDKDEIVFEINGIAY